jgi:hypothetical protein
MWGAPLYISRDPSTWATDLLLVLRLVHEPLTPFEYRHGSALGHGSGTIGQPPTQPLLIVGG